MAVTRSTVATRRSAGGLAAGSFSSRTTELIWTLAASLLIATGFYLVYKAKAPEPAATPLLNLNAINAREDLLPSLTPLFPDPATRDFVARKFYYVSGGLANENTYTMHNPFQALHHENAMPARLRIDYWG